MPERTIPQRELRNDIGRVLKEAEAGTTFVVTVRGRPVARLGPPAQPTVPVTDVDVGTLRRVLAETPVDDSWAAEIRAMREAEAPARTAWTTD